MNRLPSKDMVKKNIDNNADNFEDLVDQRPMDSIAADTVFDRGSNKYSIFKILERFKNNLFAARNYILNKFSRDSSRRPEFTHINELSSSSPASPLTNDIQKNNKNNFLKNIKSFKHNQNFITISNGNSGESVASGEVRSNSTDTDVKKENNDQIKYNEAQGCSEFTEWFDRFKPDENKLNVKIQENFSRDAIYYAENFIKKHESSNLNIPGKDLNNMLVAAKYLVTTGKEEIINVDMDTLSLELSFLKIPDDLMISNQNSSDFIGNFGRKINDVTTEKMRALDINGNTNYFLDIVFPEKSKDTDKKKYFFDTFFPEKSKEANSQEFRQLKNSEEFKQLKSDAQIFFTWRQLWAEVRAGVNEAAINFEATFPRAISSEEVNIKNMKKSNQVQLQKTYEVQKFSEKYSASEAELLACDRFIERYKLLMTNGTFEQKMGCDDLQLTEYVEDYVQFYNRSEKNSDDNKNSSAAEPEKSEAKITSEIPESQPPTKVASTNPAISLATNTAIIAEVRVNLSQPISPNRPESMGMVSGKNVTDAHQIAPPAAMVLSFPKLETFALAELQALLASSGSKQIMNFATFNAVVEKSATYFNAIAENMNATAEKLNGTAKKGAPDAVSKANAILLARLWADAKLSKSRAELEKIPNYHVLNLLLDGKKIAADFL